MAVLPEILFQDDRFVVLNKPTGLAVHPGPKGGPSVEDCFPQLSRRKDGPWLVHRLDADTAGCLLIARRKAALIAAQAEFAARRVRKTYWVVVQGGPAGDSGTVDAKLKRTSTKSGWRVVVDADGQPARSSWRVLGRGAGVSWIEFSPQTGRTHQIRVHAAFIGCPVLGDPVYGIAGPPLHLLARALEIDLDPPVRAHAPAPAHMLAALRRCGWEGDQ